MRMKIVKKVGKSVFLKDRKNGVERFAFGLPVFPSSRLIFDPCLQKK